MLDMQKALTYVKEYMSNSQTNDKSETKNKFEHIKRVHRNVKTLCNFVDDVDSDAVEIAAIFHDVACFDSIENHAKLSADIAKEYLQKEGLKLDFIDKVCQAIINHPNKTSDDNIIDTFSLEDKVLIDADMIDYTGVKEVVWTAMKEGQKEICYDLCLKKINDNIDKMNDFVKIAHTQKAKELMIRNIMVAKGVAHTIECEIKEDMI